NDAALGGTGIRHIREVGGNYILGASDPGASLVHARQERRAVGDAALLPVLGPVDLGTIGGRFHAQFRSVCLEASTPTTSSSRVNPLTLLASFITYSLVAPMS